MVDQIRSLVLASESQFRKKLLEDAGYLFTCEKPAADESTTNGASPEETACLRARLKSCSLKHADSLILGCDQTLNVDGQTLYKVDSVAAAREQLNQLNGKTHYLHSAFCISRHGEVLSESVVTAKLTMRLLRSEEIETYLKTGEWRGTVGCYRYEGKGILLFREVVGEQGAIVGLPLIEVSEALRKLGVNILLTPKAPWMLLRQ